MHTLRFLQIEKRFLGGTFLWRLIWENPANGNSKKKRIIMIILIYCTNNFPTNDNNYNKYDDSTIWYDTEWYVVTGISLNRYAPQSNFAEKHIKTYVIFAIKTPFTPQKNIFIWTVLKWKKIRNRELKRWIFLGIQVIATFFFHCTTFEVDKHRFQRLLRRRKISTSFNITSLKHV